MPANVRVITLPPDSPELNPAERLWDVVKDCLCNPTWDDLEALTAAINEMLADPGERTLADRRRLAAGCCKRFVFEGSGSVLI